MAKTLKDLETKKSIHFTLTKSAHAELRVRLFRLGLSMQEVFEELSLRIGNEMPDIIDILEELALDKRNKTLKKFSQSDAESIFSVIESENPLSGN
jgi:hypothetical protein